MKRLLFAVVLTLGACAPRPQPADVRIVFTQTPPELPFDPEDARLRAAQAQLAELAGHALVFDIDTALLPQWQGSFRHLLVAAVENVARDTRRLKEQRPKVFEKQVKKLTRIEVRYVASERSQDSELSADGSKLVVYRTADDHVLVPEGLVASHLDRAFTNGQRERLGAETASSVASSDLDAFFREQSRRYDRNGSPLTESVQAEAISSVIELDGRASGTLRTTIRQWLAGSAAGYFSQAYLHKGAEAKALPASSGFRRAERDFARWVDANQKSLPAKDRLTLLQHLYQRPFTQNREPGRSFLSFAFPGLHRDTILFDVIDEWIAAGHPMPRYSGRDATVQAGPPSNPLHDFVLCPRPKSPEGRRSLVPRCDDTLYLRALEEPAVASRLHQTLLDKKDALFTETVFVNLARRDRVELAISAWNRLADANDDAAWNLAAGVLSEELAADGALPALVTEARRLYRTRPKARGTALYVLALSNRSASSTFDWASFPKTDSPIQPSDLTAFLQAGPHGVALLPVIWPALDANVKRADLFLPAYDAFFASEETRRFDMQDPWKTLREIHGNLCRENKQNDVATIRRYYEARKRVAPEQARILADFVEETAPNVCRQDAAHHERGQRMDAEAAKRRGDR